MVRGPSRCFHHNPPFAITWNCHGHSLMAFQYTYTWWFIPLSKSVIIPVTSGLTPLIPFITRVVTHLRFVGWTTKYRYESRVWVNTRQIFGPILLQRSTGNASVVVDPSHERQGTICGTASCSASSISTCGWSTKQKSLSPDRPGCDTKRWRYSIPT